MVNKHNVDYHPSSSELTSRIHPLIFLWTPKGFISPEYFLNFSQACKSHHCCKKFWIHGITINGKYNRGWKIESAHFYSYPQAKLSPRFLSPPLQEEGNHPFSPNKVFLKSIFPSRAGDTMELKIWPKLNMQGYLLRVSINFTIYNLYIFCFCFAVL